MSLKDGLRRRLRYDSLYTPYTFSPTGKYLVYYDANSRSYFSYNLMSGKSVNISQEIPTPLYTDYQTDSLPGYRPSPVGIAGWLAKDDAVLVYDNYDIWQLDPLNT